MAISVAVAARFRPRAAPSIPWTSMRGCLGFVIVVGLTIGVLGLVAVNLVVPAIVVATVRDSSFLRGQPVTVDVSVSLGGLLRGRIDRIHVTGSGLTEGTVLVGTLDATITNASVVDHTFEDASGRLGQVRVTLLDGTPIEIATVTLAGSSTGLLGTGEVGAAQVTGLLEARLRQAGVPVDRVTFESGGIFLTAAGRRSEATLAASNGALIFDVGGGRAAVPIFEPGAGDSWTLTSVVITATGITISVDVPGPVASGG
jgi:hypothetical protein